MLPELSAYNPNAFVQSYLHKFMPYLMGAVKKERERSQAFMAIGKVGIAVGSSMVLYIEPMVNIIKEAFVIKG